MGISQAAVAEFVEAVREEYGRELSDDDAYRILADLIVYFDTLAKIHHRDVMQGEL